MGIPRRRVAVVSLGTPSRRGFVVRRCSRSKPPLSAALLPGVCALVTVFSDFRALRQSAFQLPRLALRDDGATARLSDEQHWRHVVDIFSATFSSPASVC